MSTDPHIVRDWLKALGALAAPTVSPAEAEQRLAAYVPFLVDEFPPGAFTRDSLAAVARLCPFFPSYAELAGHLSTWWSAHRPPFPQLDVPDMGRVARDELARDWSDAAGVRALAERCDGDPKLLRLLGALVARYAPQHLPLVPEHAWPEGAAQTIEHYA